MAVSSYELWDEDMAAVHALVDEGYDFAYVHVEAPDEMGHQGSVEKKVKSIEYLDDT